jgi:hypothetical protein
MRTSTLRAGTHMPEQGQAVVRTQSAAHVTQHAPHHPHPHHTTTEDTTQAYALQVKANGPHLRTYRITRYHPDHTACQHSLVANTLQHTLAASDSRPLRHALATPFPPPF